MIVVMDKIRFPRKIKVYLPLTALFLLLVFMMPKTPKFNYDYRKGSPWMYETLIAQFDFPILKTDAQLQADREKVGSTIIPYYRYDNRASSRAASALLSKGLGEHAQYRTEISDALTSILSKGVISPGSGLSLAESEDDKLIYVQKDRRAVKVPLSEVYTMEEALTAFRDAVFVICPDVNVDSLFAVTKLSDLIVPNLVFDQQTTDLVHEENINYISRTQGVVRAGQVIVSNGEIVTAEIEQLLDSYKAEYNVSVGYDGPEGVQWLGNILIAFSLVFMLFMSLYYCNHRIFDQFNKYLYLLLVFSIATAASSFVARTDPELFYMIPFTLIALYLLAFFKKRVVFTVYFISLLPMLIFAPNGVELFVMYLVAGVVCILVFGYFNRGWLQFVTAFIVFMAMVLVWGAFRMIEGLDSIGGDYGVIWNMALGSFLSVAGYPMIYLFEKIFMLVSNSKLAELSDTNNKLLRLLADKAPGTFQHALQVMNLSDAAARSIDANVLLVRAGALYHDIGKINNPQCFTENETPGVRYHADLSPRESAQEIIRHVSDGIALAEKYNLPGVIREFISTHHGTTCTAYFHNQYLAEGGNPEDVADFYYDGVKPSTKEQVILMICDAVEAASRSLKDYSKESVSALVDRIIDGKTAEGQLSDADISLRELNVMKREIKAYLMQMYHSRIAYPNRNPKQRK